MRKLRLFLVIIIALLPFGFGCQDNSPNVVHVQGNYIMPLAVGNMWVGRVQRVDSNGNVVSTSYDTLRIVRDTTIGGEQWYISNVGGLMYKNTSWGLINGNLSNPGWELEFLKYTAAVGEFCEVDTTIAGKINSGKKDTLTYGFEVASIDTSITVPLGAYSCYYYKPYSKYLDGTISNIEVPLVGHCWFAPGYGRIKTIFYDISAEDEKIKMVWELVYLELH